MPRTGLTGVSYTAPLREDMLRALSQADRPDTRNGLAQQRLEIVGSAVDDLFGAVTIVNPSGSYTLATEHSPLPLALRNGLAVPIRVRLHVDAPPGMTVTDLGEIELPPGYLPLRVPIEVHFTQRVADRRRAAHSGRRAAGRAGAAVGALQRLRQGAVLHHAVRGGGAGGCWRDDGCGTGSAASRTPPTSTGRIPPTSSPAAADREADRLVDEEPTRMSSAGRPVAATGAASLRSPSALAARRSRHAGPPTGPLPPTGLVSSQGSQPADRVLSSPTPRWCRGRGAWRSRR